MSTGLALVIPLLLISAVLSLYLYSALRKSKRQISVLRQSVQTSTTEELQVVVEQLRRSQQIAKLASWEYWPQSDTLVWSDEMYQMLGYKRGEFELNLKAVLALVHPDDTERVRQDIDDVISGDAEAYRLIHRVFRRDGAELVVHEHGTPDRGTDGKVISVKGVSQNITGLALAEEALSTQEAHNVGLMATSSAAIASADLRGNLKYWNTAFEKFIGYSSDELKNLTVRDITHPNDIVDAPSVFLQLRQGEINEFRQKKYTCAKMALPSGVI